MNSLRPWSPKLENIIEQSNKTRAIAPSRCSKHGHFWWGETLYKRCHSVAFEDSTVVSLKPYLFSLLFITWYWSSICIFILVSRVWHVSSTTTMVTKPKEWDGDSSHITINPLGGFVVPFTFLFHALGTMHSLGLGVCDWWWYSCALLLYACFHPDC